MTCNPQGLNSTEALCHFLKINTPRQEILKSNFKLMHKMIKSNQPKHIMDKLILPKRSNGMIYVKGHFQTERAKRSPLCAGIRLFNAIPPNFKVLPHKMVKKKLRKLDIEYSVHK